MLKTRKSPADELGLESVDALTNNDSNMPKSTPVVNNNLLTVALEYAKRGVSVFPCSLDKKPLTKHGFKDATTDAATIKKWWAEHPQASIGLPTGEKNGIFVLDVDVADGKQGIESLGELERTHGKLPETRRVRTGSGGLHYYFNYPVGHDLGNSTTNKLGPGLDTRGNGGYVISPPSGHKSGGYYETENRKTPKADLPAWLVTVLEKPKVTYRPATSIPPSRPELHPYVQTAIDDEIKELAETRKGARNAALNKAAFALGGWVGGGCIDEGEAERLLVNAANQNGLVQDDGEPACRKTIRSGLGSGMKEPRGIPDRATATKKTHTDMEQETAGSTPADALFTEEPIEFDGIALPQFVTTILPEKLRAFVDAVTESLQVPCELVFINALAATAVAVQKKARVFVHDGYSEPLNLYAIAALPPGERKSAVVEICKAPLVDWEQEEFIRGDDERRRARSERKNLEKLIEQKRNRLGTKNPEQREKEFSEIAELENKLPVVPEIPRLLADDITPEALAFLLSKQEECMGIMEAEGDLFNILAGMYSKFPNIGIFLKSWSGESVRVDRRNGDPVALKNPLLTLCLTPQPDVVKSLAETRCFRGKGLLGRFFFLLPESCVGFRKADAAALSESVKAKYADKIKGLLNMELQRNSDGSIVPYSIRLSPEAENMRKVFFVNNEEEMREGSELDQLRDWANKLPGNAIRIAGLLHVWTSDTPFQEKINAATMDTALKIAALFVEHAKAAFELMESDPKIECAKHILRWLKRTCAASFTARDCGQAVKGRFKQMREVTEGLDILEERFFIQKLPRTTGLVGRPSQSYAVNPLWRRK